MQQGLIQPNNKQVVAELSSTSVQIRVKHQKNTPLLIYFVFNIQISSGHECLFVENSFVWV